MSSKFKYWNPYAGHYEALLQFQEEREYFEKKIRAAFHPDLETRIENTERLHTYLLAVQDAQAAYATRIGR